ncbi:DUF2177 family protein [Lactococcus kimchii]|uniref:DUF2177 family protein n=1 Tax=Lactococcus sp. S-13 TaxID=2507158 RepID=UPI0010238067|nr:DUF2177 family protein [Lactococcus sp. S-13]RZI49401.1 DUF2177 family protein [Lactococcus sp. S-13]
MLQFFKLFLLSAAIFLVFDLFWLLVVSKKIYQHYIGHLMGEVRLLPAIVFYLLYTAGLVFFVLLVAIDKNSLIYAILAGALFGLICYATYDLTNLSTLKGWPLQMTIIDLMWGSFVSCATSALGFLINLHFLGGGGK